jgi:hypothetical protein
MKGKTDQPAKISKASNNALVNSKAEVLKATIKRTDILVNIPVSPFALKRRSNPSAAFAEMVTSFFTAVSKDKEVASAFASFQKHFKGVGLEQEDAIRLDTLMKRGAGKLKIKVGSLPSSIGPGLAYMYDAALETLRSSDHPIEPELIRARAIRIVERSFDTVLPLIGSMSVTALELALDDKKFHDHLSNRASEVETAYLPPRPSGPCEFCEIDMKGPDGQITGTYCGTQAECNALGVIVLVLFIIWLGSEIWDWLS